MMSMEDFLTTFHRSRLLCRFRKARYFHSLSRAPGRGSPALLCRVAIDFRRAVYEEVVQEFARFAPRAAAPLAVAAE